LPVTTRREIEKAHSKQRLRAVSIFETNLVEVLGARK
jgi:hypothetical protein